MSGNGTGESGTSTSSVVTYNAEMVLVRYGELGLKGGNRASFEVALCRNIVQAAAAISEVRCERSRGRITVFPKRRVEAVARRLQDVFGISSISPCVGVEPTPTAIVDAARPVFEDALASYGGREGVTFRVRSSRADKRFPMVSTDLDRHVAEAILRPEDKVVVQLKRPEITLGIDVRPERAYLFARRLPGPGGLPVGTLGKVMCLISGGIDSPVAAWMSMKRGCQVFYVTFHSYPYIGEASKKKVVDLVRHLGRYQPRSRLFVAPFTETQEAIRDHAPPSYRTVLYRRMMQRIASRLSRRAKARALITGESIGQVASQTLENMTCIENAASLPVLRPLVTFDKQETIEVAQRIGTFELSCLPEPDCCTVFMPSKPIIRGREEECLEAESRYDVEGLVERACAGVETIDVDQV